MAGRYMYFGEYLLLLCSEHVTSGMFEQGLFDIRAVNEFIFLSNWRECPSYVTNTVFGKKFIPSLRDPASGRGGKFT